MTTCPATTQWDGQTIHCEYPPGHTQAHQGRPVPDGYFVVWTNPETDYEQGRRDGENSAWADVAAILDEYDDPLDELKKRLAPSD